MAGPERVINVRYFHAGAWRARVDHLAVTGVDANVADARSSRAGKKHQIARLQAAVAIDQFACRAPLFSFGTRDLDARLPVYVLRKARTIECARTRRTVHIRVTDVPPRDRYHV